MTMTSAEREQKIERYGNAISLLIEGLKQFPKEMWQFKPMPDRWSIHETVVHIADSEANSFIRCRRAIAEPGSTVIAYDENQWAKRLSYHQQSTEDAIELFRWLRLLSYKLIKTLPEPVWSHTIQHPENGIMTLDDWLDVYAAHVPEHIEQMKQVYADWSRKQASR